MQIFILDYVTSFYLLPGPNGNISVKLLDDGYAVSSGTETNILSPETETT